MAGLNLFEYRPLGSLLHRTDPRLKFASLFLLCIAVFLCSGWGLAVLAVLVSGLLIVARVTEKSLLKSGRFFLILGVIILISRTFTAGPGTPIHPAVPSATREGIISGAVLAGRLLLFAAAGILILTTTTLEQIRGTLSRLFRIIPGVREDKLAMMAGLTMTFVPAVLKQAGEITDAQRSRCIASAKKPVRRISLFSGALLRNVFRHTDEIADAMVSRGYTGKRTPVYMKAAVRDWILFFGIAVVCGSAVAADRFL